MTARQRAWLLPPAVLFLIAGILVSREMSSPLWPWLACIPALAAILLLKGGLRFAACMALCLTLGAAVGQTAWHPCLPQEGDYEVRGIISEEITEGHFGQVRTLLSDVSLNGRPLVDLLSGGRGNPSGQFCSRPGGFLPCFPVSSLRRGQPGRL